ncbi:MAG: pilus assembly protein TadG-related protein [Ilumatobacteraceae bacterium]
MRPPRPTRDRGAVLALVVLITTTLIGAGALVIDVGAMYYEKRQLQNGADAAALAVAQDCAAGNCLDEDATAGIAASYNAKDAKSFVEVVCGSAQREGLRPCTGTDALSADQLERLSGVRGWVKVRTRTLTADNRSEIRFLLAPIMDAAAGATLRATAIAAWGYATRMRVLPLTMHECTWQQALQSVGATPEVPDALVGQLLTLSARSNQNGNLNDCTGNPNGNWGWLRNLGCGDTISRLDWISGKTGFDAPPCDWLGQEVALPIYRCAARVIDGSCTADRNGSVEYYIVGFIGFRVTALKLEPNKTLGNQTDLNASGSCQQANDRCVVGRFTRILQNGDILSGGGTGSGAVVIQMVG